jgi:hypothetical protein
MQKTQHPCDPCSHTATITGSNDGVRYTVFRCMLTWWRAEGPCDRMNDSLSGNGPARRVSDVALPVGDSA